jgi:hypothetical protein
LSIGSLVKISPLLLVVILNGFFMIHYSDKWFVFLLRRYMMIVEMETFD